MYRLMAIALAALALASCGPKGSSLEGTWAWFDPSACEGNRDTIEFAETDFFHRREGEVFLESHDVAYRVTDDSGAEWVTATYSVVSEETGATRSVALTFEPQGENILLFRGVAFDGSAPPNAGNVIGRELFRCVEGQAVLDDANGDGLLDSE